MHRIRYAHLGDVIYYNGQSSLYESQFYEPYKYYQPVIFAIPGNHDGDTQVRSGDLPDTEPSLYGFFQNFCAPQRTPISTYRDAMTQPYVYWTLEAPFVTIIFLLHRGGEFTNIEQEATYGVKVLQASTCETLSCCL